MTRSDEEYLSSISSAGLMQFPAGSLIKLLIKETNDPPQVTRNENFVFYLVTDFKLYNT